MGKLARFIRFYTEEDDGGTPGPAPILKTITGALLHITDALAKPAHELITVLTPQQDLHGQTAPYPPGATANLIPDGKNTDNGYEYHKYLKEDGTTGASNDLYVSEYFPVIENETYTWSGPSNANTSSIAFYDGSKNFLSGIAAGQALPKTFTAPAGAVYCRATQYHNFVSSGTSFQIEKGSTATTRRPYSNICPISGWTSVAVTHGSINMLSQPNQSGYYELHIPDKSYITVSHDYTSTAYRITLYDKNMSQCNWYSISSTTSDSKRRYRTVQLTSTGNRDAYYISITGNGANKQLEFGSTLHDYQPPATILNVTFTDPTTGDPLTVYDGSITLNEDGSADLVSKLKLINLSSLQWKKDTSGASNPGCVYATESTCDALGIYNITTLNNACCSMLKTPSADFTLSQWRSGGGTADGYIGRGGNYIYARPAGVTDPYDFLELIKGQIVVAPLKTPLSYHFDNIGQLQLFLGENNIWADASDDLTLTYYADGNVSDAEALNTLLGGAYVPGDVSDRDALNILLGG